MVNLSCPADEKGTDLQYELVVSARIVGVNEEETPQPPTDFPGQGDDTDKILVSTIGDIRSSIYYVAMKVVEDSGPLPRGIRFTLNRIADVPFTALDILMSKDEEGLLQATVTAVSTTGLTSLATFGIYLGVSAVVVGTLPVTTTTAVAATIASILGMGVSYFLNENMDDWYDWVENKIIDFSVKDNTLLLETTLTDMNDIKSVIDAYVNNEDINSYYDKYAIRQTIDNKTTTYIVRKGDTINGIREKYNISEEELLELNPWLEERFSPDKSFALIKPCEKIIIPSDDYIEILDLPDFLDIFDDAEDTSPIVSDPILIDLNNDGIKTTSKENGIYFDHDKDGFLEKSAWVSEQDGILFVDKNNNQVIDDGTEIFGENYIKADGTKANLGQDALADFDTNNDGIINANDTNFELLRIQKGDGIQLSLEEAGIIAINLTGNNNNFIDENGNMRVYSFSFVRDDGSIGELASYALQTDRMNTIVSELISISPEVEALPEIRNSGTLYSLRQAIMKDESSELKLLVETFCSETTTEDQRNKLLVCRLGFNPTKIIEKEEKRVA